MELQSNGQSPLPPVGRLCFRPAIPEIALAAKYLDEAISAHISGDTKLAETLIRQANIPAIRDWADSLWGKASPYVQFRVVTGAPPILKPAERGVLRMPSSAEKQLLHLRDGYHCRFCGVPVVRVAIRNRLRKLYPDALPWSAHSKEQHPAFQVMWAQYDHVLPHARSGTNDLENIIVTCAPCNFARWYYTLEEVGLADPRMREPIRNSWDGLERLLKGKDSALAL